MQALKEKAKNFYENNYKQEAIEIFYLLDEIVQLDKDEIKDKNEKINEIFTKANDSVLAQHRGIKIMLEALKNALAIVIPRNKLFANKTDTLKKIENLQEKMNVGPNSR